jgi:hypothetical protein
MKYDFQNLNLAPSPNPKPIKVLRVHVEVESAEGKIVSSGDGFITNANVHPASLIRKW